MKWLCESCFWGKIENQAAQIGHHLSLYWSPARRKVELQRQDVARMWDMALNKRPNRYIRSLCACVLKTVQNYSPQRLETIHSCFFDWCLTKTMRGYTWKWTSWVVQARSQTVKAPKIYKNSPPATPHWWHLSWTHTRDHHHEAMLARVARLFQHGWKHRMAGRRRPCPPARYAAQGWLLPQLPLSLRVAQAVPWRHKKVM